MKFAMNAMALDVTALACGLAQADTGKLLLTGGVSSIDGAAGGGLTPWAVIGSNATVTSGAAAGTYQLSGFTADGTKTIRFVKE